MTNDYPLPSDVRIGHVHLRVADLDRSIAFYRDVVGFTLNVDGRAFGVPAAFLAAGGYHHHVALNTFEGDCATPVPPGHTGLYHLAIVYPDRPSLARAIARVLAHGWSFDSGRDHGATAQLRHRYEGRGAHRPIRTRGLVAGRHREPDHWSALAVLLRGDRAFRTAAD